jgi:hypothetical protein
LFALLMDDVNDDDGNIEGHIERGKFSNATITKSCVCLYTHHARAHIRTYVHTHTQTYTQTHIHTMRGSPSPLHTYTQD